MIETLQLESYTYFPSSAYCTYAEPVSQVYDVLTNNDVGSHISAVYTTGQVTASWDGVGGGFFGYEWKVSLLDGSESVQAFTINYISISLLNCALAVWTTNDPASYSVTEQFGDYNQISIPFVTTDIEMEVGNTNFCGAKTYRFEYTTSPGSGYSWLTVDSEANYLEIQYSSGIMLGSNSAYLIIEYENEPDNLGI